MIEVIIAFVGGIVFTVVVGFFAAIQWIYSQPVVPRRTDGWSPYVRPELPKSLADLYTQINGADGSTEVQIESCKWFNLIVDFLFRQLRDSCEVKRFVMKRINKEFAELMLTKTEGKMIEQLTVRDYCLGTSMPVFNSATIIKIDCSEDSDREPVEIDIAVDVSYTGEFSVAIDADLVFNKTAFVSIQVLRVRGRGRLRFTQEPFTHWSFAFYEDPELVLKVEAQFEGRNFQQLSSFIENQIRKWVRKKHTLPSYKIRFKPFFRRCKPQDQLLDVYVHDQKVTVGELALNVVECSRLPEIEGATKVYCTLGVASAPWQPLVSLWRTIWPVHEFTINKDESQNLGIKCTTVTCKEDDENHDLVLVARVYPQSTAHATGIMKGDVLSRINNVKVTSERQVTRLIEKSKRRSILVTVQRPPSHFSLQLLSEETVDSGATPSKEIKHQCPPEDAGVLPQETYGDQMTMQKMTHSSLSVPAAEGFAAEYNKGLMSMHPPIGDIYLESSSDHQFHTGSQRGSAMSFKRMDEDSISLCGVSGERKLEIASTLRKRSPLVHSHKETSKEDDDATFLHGATATELQVPTFATASEESPSEALDTEADGGGGNDKGQLSASSQQQLQTHEVVACKHPTWNEQFTFQVCEDHHYLNVCAWAKMGDGKGDLLIGHVTIPMMDIALECLATASHTHCQRYVLTAAQPAKAGVNRATHQAMSTSKNLSARSHSKVDDRPFTGDLLLQFQHNSAADKDGEGEGNDVSESGRGKKAKQENPFHIPRPFMQHHPFTAEEGFMPSDHNFVAIESEGPQHCDICHKRIWGLKTRVLKCQNCGLKCHKKCSHYCMKEVPCFRYQVSHGGVDVDHLHQSLDGEFAVYSDDDSDSENVNGHRQLEQMLQIADEAEECHHKDPRQVHEETDLPSGDDETGYCAEGSSGSGELITPTTDSDTEQERMFKELDHSSLKNLSPLDRMATLKQKIGELQVEIDHINELVTANLSKLNKFSLPSVEEQQIRTEVMQKEEQLQQLNLLMMQHMLALNQ